MTFDKVKNIIADTINCDPKDIREDSDLKSEFGSDSLDAMELCMAIEEAFSIEIEEDAAAGFVTVRNIVEYIEKRVA